jgi:hypothetical protein
MLMLAGKLRRMYASVMWLLVLWTPLATAILLNHDANGQSSEYISFFFLIKNSFDYFDEGWLTACGLSANLRCVRFVKTSGSIDKNGSSGFSGEKIRNSRKKTEICFFISRKLSGTPYCAEIYLKSIKASLKTALNGMNILTYKTGSSPEGHMTS